MSTALSYSVMNRRTSVDKECRACLHKLDEEDGHGLFQSWYTPWAVRGAIIADDLAKFADIEISEDDIYSKVICTKCYQRLSDACTFMITIQMNDSVLRARFSKPTSAELEKTSWPQPILLNKSLNGNVDNRIEVEVKQEVLSEDENGAHMDHDWEPTMDIKIEPEEITAPVLPIVEVYSSHIGRNQETANVNGNYYRDEEYLDNIVKQESMSADELVEGAQDLPLDCMLCLKVFNSVSGLKAHVIAQHSYAAVNRNTGRPMKIFEKKNNGSCFFTCHTCFERFKTRTDLMVHKSSHSDHVCYVCDAKFKTFQQLSRHGPRCRKRRVYTNTEDHIRPPPRPQRLLQTAKKRTTISQKNEPAKKQYSKTKVTKAIAERPPIETMVIESVYSEALLNTWNSTEKIEVLPFRKSTEDRQKNEVRSDQERRKLELSNKPPENKSSVDTKVDLSEIEINPHVEEKIQDESELEAKGWLLEHEIKLELFDAQSERRLLGEDEQSEQINEDTNQFCNDSSKEEMVVEQSKETQEEPILEPCFGSLAKDNQETHICSENELNNSLDQPITSNSLENSNQQEPSICKTLSPETTEDNDLISDSVASMQSQDLANSDSLPNTPSNLTEESLDNNLITDKELNEMCLEQKSELDNSLDTDYDSSNVPLTTPSIDEISKTDVHLEINPLRDDSLLLDTEMDIIDIACERTAVNRN